jgi:arginyl-tRNA synthetase
MTDPVVSLNPLFRQALVQAFGEPFADVDPMLRSSRLADYQANVALSLAKTLRRAPRDVAAQILEHLPRAGVVERAEVSGPGFINLWLDSGFLSSALREIFADLGLTPTETPETVVIDFSSPNVAKEMHVGHLRSTIIGDALSRVFEAAGHRVIRQNHLGDWGTPFGMLIEHLLDVEASDPSIEDLNAFYQAARRKFDSDPAFADRARLRVVALQKADPETLAYWRKLVAASMRYFNAIYEVLGVTLKDEHIAAESLYNPWLKSVVDELLERQLAVESDGAICVFPPGFLGRDEKPVPLIIRKQDGGYGYATTDLVALRHRTQTLKATRILYVVGATQAQHLSMVFASAGLAGWLVAPARAEHVAFGSILGADKKMFRTRAGETVRLIDLLNEGVVRAQSIVAEKNPELSADVQASIARAVGIGAVKYGDLSSDRGKDYVFDWDRMLAFDGNTAPYLQYAHARIRSIFRKGNIAVQDAAACCIGEPEERALALVLLTFPSVVRDVTQTLDPHKICGYLYDLATTFSTFYERCPVLKAKDPGIRASRLVLCELTARVLGRGLYLLGIEAPEKM